MHVCITTCLLLHTSLLGRLMTYSPLGYLESSELDQLDTCIHMFAVPTTVQPSLSLPCSSELRLTSSKCRQRAGAEAAWLRLYRNHGLPAHVFRLGGD